MGGGAGCGEPRKNPTTPANAYTLIASLSTSRMTHGSREKGISFLHSIRMVQFYNLIMKQKNKQTKKM